MYCDRSAAGEVVATAHAGELQRAAVRAAAGQVQDRPARHRHTVQQGTPTTPPPPHHHHTATTTPPHSRLISVV